MPSNSPRKSAVLSELRRLSRVKVVILGQDPYHNTGQAMGLAFSVPVDVKKLPPSLPRILQEAGIPKEAIKASGDLTSWARQGVLLLNPVLTVAKGQPGSHQHWGWQQITSEVLNQLSTQVSDRRIIFLLWGGKAAQLDSLIDSNKHLILKASHPSPLATRGDFIGCGHFQKANECLEEQGLRPIQWDSVTDPEWAMTDGEEEQQPMPNHESPSDTSNENLTVVAILPQNVISELVDPSAALALEPDQEKMMVDVDDTVPHTPTSIS